MDLAPDDVVFESQRKFLEELLKEYREVETAIECSARSMQYVQEVFHFALKAVCHPQFPLYDTINQRLKPRCSQALKRIFLLCDRDKDNRLDEEELNDFQVKCFESPLQPEELMGVVETVKEKLPLGVHGTGLTVSGFLFLHALFMERGRYETTWTVLRKFGYTNELTLSDEILDAVPFDHAPDQILQLSDKAVEFLKDWFLSLDETGSKTVQEAKIHSRIEETSPERMWTGPLWERLFVSAAPVGHVTLQGFLSKWHYAMLIDPKSCLKQLLYMGWSNEMVPSMFTLSKHRKQERRELSSRSVMQCWVFGSEGSGKTTFLKALVGPGEMQNTENGIEDQHEEFVAADSISLVHTEKTLIMTEVSSERANRLVSKAVESAVGQPFEAVDVAVFLYAANDRRSFVEAQNLMLKVSEAAGDYLPCLLICAKNELSMASGLKDAVENLCDQLKLRPPVLISAQDRELNDVFQTIMQTAVKPTIDTIPETPARKSQRMRRLWTKRLIIAGGVASAVALFTVYVYPRYRKSSTDLPIEFKNSRR